MNDNHMVINGVRYPVIEAWPEAYDSGRFRWAVVTEGQETAGACHCGAPATAGPHPDVRAEAQPAPPAEATVTMMPKEYYAAEFGSLDTHEHTSEIGPTVGRTSAFLAPIDQCPGGESCPGHPTV